MPIYAKINKYGLGPLHGENVVYNEIIREVRVFLKMPVFTQLPKTRRKIYTVLFFSVSRSKNLQIKSQFAKEASLHASL